MVKKILKAAALIIVILVLAAGSYMLGGKLGGSGGSDSGRNHKRNKVEAVEELLGKMTLEEKVGQVIVSYFNGPEFTPALAAEMREIHPGGIILFSHSGNIETPDQVAAMTAQIQQWALDSGFIPLFIAVDQEGGAVARLTEGVTVFPGNMALGATGSEELARLSAAVTARELRLLGINFNFAPVVDVNNNPADPGIGVRSFGSDPAQVARLGAAMVGPYREAGVLATAKHFPGHGDTTVDSHYGLPLIAHDRSRLERVELPPFQAMIDAGVPAVMMAHILMPELTGSSELPVSLSPQAVRFLREEMGFDGLIVSDSMSMGAISSRWGLEEASVMAFQAGVDIILFGPWTGVEPGDRKRIFTALKEAVQNGAITPERLDQSVRRILTAKMEYGIMEDPWPRRENLDALGTAEHREIARRIARESITLVRDRSALIPLPAQEGLPVIWPAEKEKSLAPLLETCPFLEPRLLPLGASAAEVEELVESMRGFSPVLVGTYELQRYPAWSGMVNKLTEVAEVAVLAMASPYDLLEVPHAAAYLAAYNDSSDSVQALGEILRGTLAPQGRLPVELPGY